MATKEALNKTTGSLWSRRDFMGRLGWGMFSAFTGLTLLGFLRSAFPRVLFTPPTSFKAGFPRSQFGTKSLFKSVHPRVV